MDGPMVNYSPGDLTWRLRMAIDQCRLSSNATVPRPASEKPVGAGPVSGP